MDRLQSCRMLSLCTRWTFFLLCVIILAQPHLTRAEGSRNIWPQGQRGYRASLEWRNSVYGPQSFNLKRRTLLKVYAEQGEYLLAGSTAVGVSGTPNLGDIRIYNPGVVTGTVGSALIPALDPPLNDATQPGVFGNGFSCVAQRQSAGNESRGRIASRAQELAGPNTEDNDIPEGYRPCVYQAPATGIYNIVFLGPRGDNSDSETAPRGLIEWDGGNALDAGSEQDTSVTAWDVTVRTSLSEPVERIGRLFTYYFTGFTGSTGRTIYSPFYVVTNDGFIYEVQFNTDPFGFLFYANQKGFENTDGTPLYRNVLATPNLLFEEQNQLYELQGNVRLLPPDYPILFSLPAPETLRALGIPARPRQPNVTSLSFSGVAGDATLAGIGGSFSFNADSAGIYTLVVSRDGQDFDPTSEQNRVLRGTIAAPGTVTVVWDGRDNAGQLFPEGGYAAQVYMQGGEVHFPFFDVENNPNGGPRIRMVNPPDRTGDGVGDCPPWKGECRGAFYDDRGYRTAAGALVGTAVNGWLCANNVGNPPNPLRSDPFEGFDTGSAQRRFGFMSRGNPASVCLPDGGFGDKKGLDLWTFYPSQALITPLGILGPTELALARFTATREAGGVAVEWLTASERETWGFRLYRSASGRREDARLVSEELIAARGSAGAGASYRWLDADVDAGTYSYWLEEVERSGTSREYGPAMTAAQTAGRGANLWLALLLR